MGSFGSTETSEVSPDTHPTFLDVHEFGQSEGKIMVAERIWALPFRAENKWRDADERVSCKE